MGEETVRKKNPADWQKVSPKDPQFIPLTAISYVICKGGDVMRPMSVLATTRNLSTDDLATASWVGADQVDGKKKPHPNIMANLETSQGQIVMADGSTKEITLKCRIDTAIEIEYIEHGGVLHYVLRNLAKSA